MATVNTHISALRALINKYGDTDTPYTDDFLYHIFGTAATRLMRQRYGNSRKTNSWDVAYYCVELEKAQIADCVNLPQCAVLRTKCKIPKPLSGKYTDLIKVYTVDHREISFVVPEAAYSLKFDDVMKDKLAWSLINQYIVIWNGDLDKVIPRAVLVGGYFEDHTEWADIPCVDNAGQYTNYCYDILQSSYPIDSDLVNAAYLISLETLSISIRTPNDRRNDGNEITQR